MKNLVIAVIASAVSFGAFAQMSKPAGSASAPMASTAPMTKSTDMSKDMPAAKPVAKKHHTAKRHTKKASAPAA